MPDDTNDTLANSPKDPVTGDVKPSSGPSGCSGTEAEEAAGRNASPTQGATPAGQRNTAYEAEDGEHADHETEEAAAYRENDA